MKNMKMELREMIGKGISEKIINNAINVSSYDKKDCTIIFFDEVEMPDALIRDELKK